MRLILVRHAETVENVNHINQGRTDGTLTILGRRQASELAKHLCKYDIDVIYTSDLSRVQETLAPLKELLPHIEVRKTKLLRERDFGEDEGSPWGTVRKKAETAGIPVFDYRPEGGESLRDLRERIVTFVKALLKTHPEGNVCCFTHGGPMTQLSMALLDIPEERFSEWRFSNTEILLLHITGEKTELVARDKLSR